MRISCRTPSYLNTIYLQMSQWDEGLSQGTEAPSVAEPLSKKKLAGVGCLTGIFRLSCGKCCQQCWCEFMGSGCTELSWEEMAQGGWSQNDAEPPHPYIRGPQDLLPFSQNKRHGKKPKWHPATALQEKRGDRLTALETWLSH